MKLIDTVNSQSGSNTLTWSNDNNVSWATSWSPNVNVTDRSTGYLGNNNVYRPQICPVSYKDFDILKANGLLQDGVVYMVAEDDGTKSFRSGSDGSILTNNYQSEHIVYSDRGSASRDSYDISVLFDLLKEVGIDSPKKVSNSMERLEDMLRGKAHINYLRDLQKVRKLLVAIDEIIFEA